MDNVKIYQICYHLITYFAILISLKRSQLDPIFRTGGSIKYTHMYIYNMHLHSMDRKHLTKSY